LIGVLLLQLYFNLKLWPLATKIFVEREICIIEEK